MEEKKDPRTLETIVDIRTDQHEQSMLALHHRIDLPYWQLSSSAVVERHEPHGFIARRFNTFDYALRSYRRDDASLFDRLGTDTWRVYVAIVQAADQTKINLNPLPETPELKLRKDPAELSLGANQKPVTIAEFTRHGRDILHPVMYTATISCNTYTFSHVPYYLLDREGFNKPIPQQLREQLAELTGVDDPQDQLAILLNSYDQVASQLTHQTKTSMPYMAGQRFVPRVKKGEVFTTMHRPLRRGEDAVGAHQLLHRLRREPDLIGYRSMGRFCEYLNAA